MNLSRNVCLLIVVLLPFVLCAPGFAQCSGNLLCALDEENPVLPGLQRFAASVWTNDIHCPASGQIHFMCNPPGMVGFEYDIDSFFDVFTEVHTTQPIIFPITQIPDPFQIITEVTFDDPAFLPLMYVEQVVWNPAAMRYQIFRPTPCTGDVVPPMLVPGQSACFVACHKIYHVNLGPSAGIGQPIISIVPGCEGNACPPLPCNPGMPYSYRSDVYESGGQWWLEFEYSDPMNEPACYCVTYVGNEPPEYEVHTLAAFNEEAQTFDITLWTDSGDEFCGTIEAFSYRIGGRFGVAEPTFGPGTRKVFHIPAAAGELLPGEQFQAIAYVDWGATGLCVEHGRQWLVEDMVVAPSGGLVRMDTGGECADGGGSIVPPQLVFGSPQCIQVCHDIYHIPLVFPGPGIPVVSVFEGCGPLTPCPPLPGCDPGLPYEYRYDVFKVGGTWILEFEHSNPLHEPVCYCIDISNILPLPYEPIVLGALDESRQMFDLSVRSTSPMMPLSGQVVLRTNPPGGPWIVDSFFDVYLEPRRWEFPIPTGGFIPGDHFQIIAEFDFFGPGSDPFEGQVCTENVMVTPSGQLMRWDPITPCTGDFVPSNMMTGQTECFRVCHRIYETILNYPPGGGRPVISVTPGCQGPPMDNCLPFPCVPGGPNDFVYEVYHNGVDWVLRFEYSNPYIEPVCYCVSYTGNVPWDCETRELAALDEGHMNFDVSVRTFSAGGMECPASGQMTLFSWPEGAMIGPYPPLFVAGTDHWYSMEAPVGPGSFGPGDPFQLVAYIDYTDPGYPDQWLTEEVVVEPSGQYLWIRDAGGECTGDQVPMLMNMGENVCFKVCHRIYHVGLNWFDPTLPPIVNVTPGCFGPPQDLCEPHPECVPGGLFDYRYDLNWVGDHWELEFEYSNENVEPVCYCVSAQSPVPPCTTHELVALDEEYQTLDITLWVTGDVEPCEASGILTVAAPPDVFIGPFIPEFNVGGDWSTVRILVGPGALPPGTTFQFVVFVDYFDPIHPDVSIVEDVVVDGAGMLQINDVGGECIGDQVPPVMFLNTSECFRVCHRVYHIAIANALDPADPPAVTVIPGCYGPPQDPCLPILDCTPGHPNYFRYDLFWRGDHWELEFEYSNANVEPVCYCVTVEGTPPCLPVRDLVIQWPDPAAGVPIRLAWTCPQRALYKIYGTSDPNLTDPPPPAPGWILEDQILGIAGEQKIWYSAAGSPLIYHKYVVIADCTPPTRQ